jgi:hypothetical protein
LILFLVPAVHRSNGQGKLILQSGFEKNTRLMRSGKGDVLTGTDRSTGFSWDKNNVPGKMSFFYLSGDQPRNYASTRIEKVTGHDGKPTQAIYMEVKKDYPEDKFGAVSRNEFSFFPDSTFTEGYVSYWMKLQDNLTEIAPKTKTSVQLAYYRLDSWRMLMEIKEPDSGVSISGRGTNNYRISFFIARDSLNGQMYWLLRAEMPQPVRKTDWEIENCGIRVPVGEWFKTEVYFKKGKKDGLVWWAVNGKEIACHHGRTEHPDNPLPVKFWSFFKLYQDEKWLNNGPVFQWVDDLTFWSGFPPEYKMLNN